MKSVNQRVLEAQERIDYWRSLSPAEQLKDLDRRLGVGVGAKRQRTMLVNKLHPPTPAPAAAASEPTILTPATPKKKFKKGNKKLTTTS